MRSVHGLSRTRDSYLLVSFLFVRPAIWRGFLFADNLLFNLENSLSNKTDIANHHGKQIRERKLICILRPGTRSPGNKTAEWSEGQVGASNLPTRWPIRSLRPRDGRGKTNSRTLWGDRQSITASEGGWQRREHKSRSLPSSPLHEPKRWTQLQRTGTCKETNLYPRTRTFRERSTHYITCTWLIHPEGDPVSIHWTESDHHHHYHLQAVKQATLYQRNLPVWIWFHQSGPQRWHLQELGDTSTADCGNLRRRSLQASTA